MAIEREIVAAVQRAIKAGRQDQRNLGTQLLGELAMLKRRGFEDPPLPPEVKLEVNEEAVFQAPPGWHSVVDELMAKRTPNLFEASSFNLPGEEKLIKPAKALLDLLAIRFSTETDELVTLMEMSKYLRQQGFTSSIDSTRQTLYAIRKLMREEKHQRYDIVNVFGKGYRIERHFRQAPPPEDWS